jgi:hypothetical protein
MSRQIGNESKKIIISNIIPILHLLPTIRETQRNSRWEAIKYAREKNLLFVIHTK